MDVLKLLISIHSIKEFRLKLIDQLNTFPSIISIKSLNLFQSLLILTLNLRTSQAITIFIINSMTNIGNILMHIIFRGFIFQNLIKLSIQSPPLKYIRNINYNARAKDNCFDCVCNALNKSMLTDICFNAFSNKAKEFFKHVSFLLLNIFIMQLHLSPIK